MMLLIGARQTGKTTLLNALAQHLRDMKQSVTVLTLEDKLVLARLNTHPEELFQFVTKQEKFYVLIDEIQYLDDPSNFLKYLYDMYSPHLKLIVTGSSAFYIDQKFKDSLAGRKRIHWITPLTFSEFLTAKNKPELASLFVDGEAEAIGSRAFLIPQKQALEAYLEEYLRYGGYPDVVLSESEADKQVALKELHLSFLQKDFLESKIQYQDKAYMLLKILASQVGQLVNTQELAGTLGISGDTVKQYLYLLEKSFIIKLCRPFYQNIRKELTKMPKVYFLDLGFRNTVLGQFGSTQDRLDKGQVLENGIFIGLLQRGIERIQFWRTQSKKEIDFVLDEKYAFEAKFSARQFKEKEYKEFGLAYQNITLAPIFFRKNEKEELDMLDVFV